ncbi:hypothetical protein SAMN05444273_103511 [Litoreibacter ascidiaceicola]|uniref:Uncharacterized protein n=1 Tax=Litoreibacter ascidiaceicola TaxID=1486859 RepID=A0A1M4YDK5_9RHOB|nr:hypothetical protein [Litoreibacter ascidiaceicola]SHF03914.1 hypothetical protein SAMN05444273_103511 [Litoreibacter ascidiaceicola]
MSFVISAPSVSDLRFDNLYKRILAYLMELDSARFRALGDANCRAFVRKGVSFCDARNLGFVEHIEYVHFLMYFIGTDFDRDPRYSALTQALSDQDHVANERVETAHRLFRPVAERFIGVGLAQAHVALSRFYETMEHTNDDQLTPRLVFDAFYAAYDFAPTERDRFPEAALVDAAVQGAQALGIETALGRGVCLSLALWLGTGFTNDPLFPWVRDVTAQAPNNANERALALKAYAQKRMIKMRPKEES